MSLDYFLYISFDLMLQNFKFNFFHKTEIFISQAINIIYYIFVNYTISIHNN